MEGERSRQVRTQQRWRQELDRQAYKTKWDIDSKAAHEARGLEMLGEKTAREIKDLAREQRRGGQGGWGGGSADREKYAQMDDAVLRWAVYAVGGLIAIAAFALVLGHVTALLFDGSWPRYEAGDVPDLLQELVRNPGDPSVAWESVGAEGKGGTPPGPIAWWLLFFLAGIGAVYGGMWLYRTLRDTDVRAGGGRRSGGRPARASWFDRRRLRVRGEEEGRLVVGTRGRKKLGIDPLHSLLVVGPGHSGKTSGLAIPTLLEWRGPAVVASTKGHLMDETIGWRSHQGDVHVFDPAAVSRYRRSGWSLLADCQTWEGAIRTAQHLTTATKASVGGRIDGEDSMDIQGGDLWSSAMAMSLAPYLFAAATEGKSIIDAAQWIEREERDEVLEILKPRSASAARAHETTFFRPDESRSTYFHFMYQVLSVYGDPSVRTTADRHEIVASELLDGGHHTLYLTAPEHDQVRFRPLFAALVRQIITEADDRFAAKGEALRPPLLLLLDEAVGVASVDDLAAIASSGAAKGVQVVSIFQDLNRFERVHSNAEGLLTRSHRARLVLSGDVEAAAAAAEAGYGSPDVAVSAAAGDGVLHYGNTAPVHVRLRRWYHDAELRRRVETAQDVIEPSERRAARRAVTGTSVDEQTSAWFKREKDWSGEPPQDPVSPTEEQYRLSDLFGRKEEDRKPNNVTDARDRFRR